MVDEQENSGKSSPGGSPFHPALVRKLVQSASNTGSRNTTAREEDHNNNTNNAPKRMTPEAMLLAGELLRLFVLEARQRAAIEAECEREGSTELAGSGSVERQADENEEGSLDRATSSIMVIQPHHITKVAAELLMDFS